jgi:hypothetical protein
MKLKQIKEFNKETVTNEIAYKIFAVAGLWNAYSREEYISRGFECEERWCGQRIGGGGSNHQAAWSNPDFKQEGYERTFEGLTLKPIDSTPHKFHLNKDGRVTVYNVHEKGSWKGWSSKDGDEYYDKFEMNLEYHCNQIKLMQLYLDLGFYTVEI